MIKTIVVVDRNENNKIELTKEELTNLLNEIYLNALLKHQTALENKINNLEKQITELQEKQKEVVPWYKKLFKL